LAASGAPIRVYHRLSAAKKCFISLIGTRSGLGHPKPSEATRYLTMLPPGIGTTWSHTQWEVFFALHYKKKIVAIQASGDWKPDTDGAPDDQQTRFVAYLQSLGTDLKRAMTVTTSEDAPPVVVPVTSLQAWRRTRWLPPKVPSTFPP
jgi:hypothetical protein